MAPKTEILHLPVYDRAVKDRIACRIIVNVDHEKIARVLGPKALRSRRSISKSIQGAVTCKVERLDGSKVEK